MLPLVPFASKLVNYSRRNESFSVRKNSKSVTFSFENDDLSMFKDSSKAHCDSINLELFGPKKLYKPIVKRILDQFLLRRCQKKRN